LKYIEAKAISKQESSISVETEFQFSFPQMHFHKLRKIAWYFSLPNWQLPKLRIALSTKKLEMD
jgi:hypothetical protein